MNSVNLNLEGAYRVAAVDAATDEIIWEQKDWKKNLILNQGMDRLISGSIVGAFTYGIAGTGTRPNSFYSSGSEADAQNGILSLTASGVITDFTSASYTYPTIVQLGDVIKFDYLGTPEFTVTSVNSSSLIVTPTSSFATGSFTIWKTSQTSLEQERKRSNTYVASANSSDFQQDGYVTHRRTIDFTTDTASVNYTEIGTSWATLAANNTFTRVLLDSPIIINAGQKLRLYYQMKVGYSPIYSQSFSASVDGWDIANTGAWYQIQTLSGSFGPSGILYFLSFVTAATGATHDTAASLEPFFGTYAYISTVNTPVAPFRTPISRNGTAEAQVALTKVAYVTGSYEVYKYGTFSEASFASTQLYSMGLGVNNVYYGVSYQINANAFNLVFTTPQVKTNTQTFTVYYKWSWARTLQ